MNISWGSLQGKKSKYHSLSILLKLLAFSWAGQRVVWGEGEFCLILRFFLSGLAASTFIHQLINKITDLRFHCRWVVLTLSSSHSALFGLNSFLSFEELRNKNNPEQLPLFPGQFHSFEMEIFNIALVNCENQLYCLSVPTRWPTDLLLTSSCGFFNSNFYFFLHSFLRVWNIFRTPYLFQLYIFIMTFLSKEFIKAQYLYTHTHTHTHTHTQLLRIKGYYQKMKTQAIEWKNLFANHTSDKGPVPECTGFVYSEWEQLVIAIGSFCGWREGWTRSLGLTDANCYSTGNYIPYTVVT